MASKAEMEEAVEKLDGSDLGGRAIQARVSLPKEKLPVKKDKPARRARGGTDGPKIYVGNLPYGVDEAELSAFFAEHGEVASVYLVKDDQGQDRGFGFITMATEEGVDAAVSKVDGSFFQGRRLAARRPLAEGERAEPAPPRKLFTDNSLFLTWSSTNLNLLQNPTSNVFTLATFHSIPPTPRCVSCSKNTVRC